MGSGNERTRRAAVSETRNDSRELVGHAPRICVGRVGRVKGNSERVVLNADNIGWLRAGLAPVGCITVSGRSGLKRGVNA